MIIDWLNQWTLSFHPLGHSYRFQGWILNRIQPVKTWILDFVLRERILHFLCGWGCEIRSCCSHTVTTRREPVGTQNPHKWALNSQVPRELGTSFEFLWRATSKAGPTSGHLKRHEPELDCFFGQLQSQKSSENVRCTLMSFEPKRLKVGYSLG